MVNIVGVVRERPIVTEFTSFFSVIPCLTRNLSFSFYSSFTFTSLLLLLHFSFFTLHLFFVIQRKQSFRRNLIFTRHSVLDTDSIFSQIFILSSTLILILPFTHPLIHPFTHQLIYSFSHSLIPLFFLRLSFLSFQHQTTRPQTSNSRLQILCVREISQKIKK